MVARLTQYFTILPFWYSSPQPKILTERYPVLDLGSTFEHLYTPDLYTKNSLDTFITAENMKLKLHD